MNQPSVQVKSPTQNGDNVASLSSGEHGVEVDNSSEDEVQIVDASNNKMGIPMPSAYHNNECGGCAGNSHNCCHNCLFGLFLCQDILGLFDTYPPHEITKNVIKHEFKMMYQLKLRIFCWDKMHKYDTKRDYLPPKCLCEHSLKFSKDLVQAQKTLSIMSKRREYGVALIHFTFQTLEDQENEIEEVASGIN